MPGAVRQSIKSPTAQVKRQHHIASSTSVPVLQHTRNISTTTVTSLASNNYHACNLELEQIRHTETECGWMWHGTATGCVCLSLCVWLVQALSLQSLDHESTHSAVTGSCNRLSQSNWLFCTLWYSYLFWYISSFSQYLDQIYI